MSDATATKPKKPMSNKRFLWIWVPILAFVTVIAVGANVAIGMFRGAIESYMAPASRHDRHEREPPGPRRPPCDAAHLPGGAPRRRLQLTPSSVSSGRAGAIP